MHSVKCGVRLLTGGVKWSLTSQCGVSAASGGVIVGVEQCCKVWSNSFNSSVTRGVILLIARHDLKYVKSG